MPSPTIWPRQAAAVTLSRRNGSRACTLEMWTSTAGAASERAAAARARVEESLRAARSKIDELDAEMARHGARLRILPPLDESFEEPLQLFLLGIEEDRYSWTWKVPEGVRLQAAAELRAWARDRFGSLEESRAFTLATTWRAYDLPERAY